MGSAVCLMTTVCEASLVQSSSISEKWRVQSIESPGLTVERKTPPIGSRIDVGPLQPPTQHPRGIVVSQTPFHRHGGRELCFVETPT